MNTFLKQAWQRFKSAVPATERKLQLLMIGASSTFGSMSAISWPGKMEVVGTLCGYAAASCAGMALLLQFAVQAQGIGTGDGKPGTAAGPKGDAAVAR